LLVDKKVSIFKQTPENIPVEASTFEPGFEYSRTLILNNSDRGRCERLARYLDRRIRRFPKDLTAHVQRINALVAAGAQGDRLYAAAIDLNTVLGRSGKGLQRSIRDKISYMLSDQQCADLDVIRAGLSVSDSPALRLCLLPRNNESEHKIVANVNERSQSINVPGS